MRNAEASPLRDQAAGKGNGGTLKAGQGAVAALRFVGESSEDRGAMPTRAIDRDVVLSQLERILANSHFRNSKRSQALLRYVVEASLAADLNSLKERCIGVAVFHRDPAYDTTQDPIVRNAAIDVRKRLAQYYMEPEHAAELRIELPTGSYQATFIEPSAGFAVVEPPPAVAEKAAPAADPLPVVAPPSALPVSPVPERAWRPPLWIFLTAAALLMLGAVYAWMSHRTPASELDAFWAPLFRDDKTIQICVGQPTRLFRFTGPRTEELNRALGGSSARSPEASALTISGGELAWVAPDFLYFRDALSGFRVASWIQSKGRPYHLVPVASANYSQLRHTPLVAIGAFNNTWSMRVTSQLRFIFERRVLDGKQYNCIIDRRNPGQPLWKVAQPLSPVMEEDFAIVTRVFDPTTERTVISAAGIETYGTMAASEFVTQPDYLGKALVAGPAEWRQQNVQFVLGTRIIDGTPGPPRVLAAYYW
jgi:hypothetical protein